MQYVVKVSRRGKTLNDRSYKLEGAGKMEFDNHQEAKAFAKLIGGHEGYIVDVYVSLRINCQTVLVNCCDISSAIRDYNDAITTLEHVYEENKAYLVA